MKLKVLSRKGGSDIPGSLSALVLWQIIERGQIGGWEMS